MNTFHGHNFVIKMKDGSLIGNVAVDGGKGQAQVGRISRTGTSISMARAEL
jgi:hypothetical protein